MGIMLALVIGAASFGIIGYCIKDVGRGNGVKPVGGKIGSIICASISYLLSVGILIFSIIVKDTSLIIGSIICLAMVGSMIYGIVQGNFDNK